jgi:hypothetical protein
VWEGVLRGYFVNGEFVHFFEVLTLYGSVVMVGSCVEILRLYVSWMICCSGVVNV